MQFYGWQESFDGGLVNDFLLILCHDGIHEGCALADETFITTAAIELDNEITALGSQTGGVGAGLDEYSDIIGMVETLFVLNEEIAEETADVVGLFHIGSDINMPAESDSERIVDQT